VQEGGDGKSSGVCFIDTTTGRVMCGRADDNEKDKRVNLEMLLLQVCACAYSVASEGEKEKNSIQMYSHYLFIRLLLGLFLD
jgi:hypothetical protein